MYYGNGCLIRSVELTFQLRWLCPVHIGRVQESISRYFCWIAVYNCPELFLKMKHWAELVRNMEIEHQGLISVEAVWWMRGNKKNYNQPRAEDN